MTRPTVDCSSELTMHQPNIAVVSPVPVARDHSPTALGRCKHLPAENRISIVSVCAAMRRGLWTCVLDANQFGFPLLSY